ncbi:hypothetical protein BaRGS_00001403 [Batillaria attramentaria]|uniref:Uncharacterized protein n=1 Tax=Batillaria attramentaria TaxID=370345 RepID=A0ABD0M899_9CAEN
MARRHVAAMQQSWETADGVPRPHIIRSRAARCSGVHSSHEGGGETECTWLPRISPGHQKDLSDAFPLRAKHQIHFAQFVLAAISDDYNHANCTGSCTQGSEAGCKKGIPVLHAFLVQIPISWIILHTRIAPCKLRRSKAVQKNVS